MSDGHAIFSEYISNTHAVNKKLWELTLDMQQHVNLDNVNMDKDPFGLMALSYTSKQLEHFKSVCLLVDAGQHRDAVALARVMMEGFIILKWASEGSEERARSWIKYSAVEQFRRFYGTSRYAENKTRIESNLKAYGTSYLKQGSKSKPPSEITPDDYITNWRGEPDGDKFTSKKIKDIFKDTGFEKMHEEIYNPASGWVHWDSLSLQGAIQVTADAVIYGVETKHLGVAAIAVGFDSLIDTAKLLEEHFELGYSDRLIKLGKDHQDMLEGIRNAYAATDFTVN